MISRCTSSVPKVDVVFPRLLNSDSRCSQMCRHALPGDLRLVVGTPRLVTGAPRCSQTCRRHSPTCCRRSQVLQGAPKVLSCTLRCSQTYHNHSHSTPVPVIWDSSYSEGWQKWPPRVWYSPEIDASKFTLHILSDPAGVFQWPRYILLMDMLHNAPRAQTVSATQPLGPSLTGWRRCVERIVYFPYLPAMCGKRILFGASTMLFCFDYVDGWDVGCCNIWTPGRKAVSFMSRLIHLFNLNKAKSVFWMSLHWELQCWPYIIS